MKKRNIVLVLLMTVALGGIYIGTQHKSHLSPLAPRPTLSRLSPESATMTVPKDESATMTVPKDESTTVTVPMDESTTVTIPMDESTTVTVPMDESTTVTVPMDESTTATVPMDESTTVTVPVDESATVTIPMDESTTVTIPMDESTTATVPMDESTTATVPMDESTTVTVPMDESTTVTVPMDELPVYALTISYLGQQSTGIRTVISQQCVMGQFHFPVYVVEPFIPESSFKGLVRQPRKTKHVPSMKDYFDFDLYNAAADEKGWARVAPREDFIKNASHRAVLVRLNVTTACACMAGDKPELSAIPKVEWSASTTNSCYQGNGAIQDLPHNLCIVRVINANASPYIDLSAGEEVLFGQWKPHEVTLIFDRWCPSTYLHLNNFVGCKGACEEGLENLLYPSPMMLKHVENYEAKFQTGSSYFQLAVMIRAELTKATPQLFYAENGSASDLQDCLDKLINITHQVVGNSSYKLFVAADVGRYGSGSWKGVPRTKLQKLVRDKMVQSVKDTVVTLLKGSLTFKEWEDTFTSVTAGMNDRGYIAALQRTIASRADCLITLGGGNFNRIALYEYLNKHPDPSSWCIHFVCTPKGFYRSYRQIISERKTGTKIV